MKVASDQLTSDVLGLVIEVHRTLGPGLFESVYEAALAYELRLARIEFKRQMPIKVCYKGINLGVGFRADFLW